MTNGHVNIGRNAECTLTTGIGNNTLGSMVDAATGDHYYKDGGKNNATSGLTVMEKKIAEKMHMTKDVLGNATSEKKHKAMENALTKLYMVNTSNVATSGHNMDAEKDGGAVTGVDLTVLAGKGAVGHDLVVGDYLNDMIGMRKVIVVVALAGKVVILISVVAIC